MGSRELKANVEILMKYKDLFDRQLDRVLSLMEEEDKPHFVQTEIPFE